MNLPNLDPQKTILTITLGFGIVYLITWMNVFIYTSMAIGLLGLLSPYVAKKITLLWSVITWLLSMIIPNIMLGLIFYLILFPLAFIRRVLTRKNYLFLNPPSHSLFKDKQGPYTAQNFEKLW